MVKKYNLICAKMGPRDAIWGIDCFGWGLQQNRDEIA